MKLATGKRTHFATTIGKMQFKLGGYQTSANLRILPLGNFDGILGMDWLASNNSIIECQANLLKFKSLLGEEVNIVGIRGKPKLHLIAATKLLKAYCKKQMVYAVKLNPIDKPSLPSEPTWLAKYVDVFPKDLA